jgi:hypothetical protein
MATPAQLPHYRVEIAEEVDVLTDHQGFHGILLS